MNGFLVSVLHVIRSAVIDNIHTRISSMGDCDLDKMCECGPTRVRTHYPILKANRGKVKGCHVCIFKEGQTVPSFCLRLNYFKIALITKT